ncbi:uncharacterized protein LOC107621696 [Arachis ipaensis]|nr:uncharacterized protein LOC107621696 [Arachis ipaensis]XP_025684356.1 uncharacterized protein LOC112785136 [Arachis hypogaea]
MNAFTVTPSNNTTHSMLKLIPILFFLSPFLLLLCVYINNPPIPPLFTVSFPIPILSLSILTPHLQMADELHESDVVFANQHQVQASSWDHNNNKNKKKKNNNKVHPVGSSSADNRSLPVNIPESRRLTMRSLKDSSQEEEEMVPPHVMVARRVVGGGKMAFSVCTGHGRTLKGRDLSQVRNSVLRMTGFLEA